MDSLLARPVAVQPVPGTPFALALVGVAPISSGPATGSLVAGVASILVSLVVACFGLTGAASGWGPVVSGAFAILAGVAGLGGVVLGLVSLRQVKAGAGQVSGRGMAIAGIICGGLGLLLTVFAFVAGFALVISD